MAKEYLKFFEFQGLSLEDCLRQFLSCFSLTGESQERERVMVYFSEHYHECNPHAYRSSDEVHGITVALLLLNTDLHSEVGVVHVDLVGVVITLGLCWFIVHVQRRCDTHHKILSLHYPNSIEPMQIGLC